MSPASAASSTTSGPLLDVSPDGVQRILGCCSPTAVDSSLRQLVTVGLFFLLRESVQGLKDFHRLTHQRCHPTRLTARATARATDTGVEFVGNLSEQRLIGATLVA